MIDNIQDALEVFKFQINNLTNLFKNKTTLIHLTTINQLKAHRRQKYFSIKDNNDVSNISR